MQSTKNVRLIAQSLERRKKLEEKLSALFDYCLDKLEKKEDLKDRAENFPFLPKNHLRSLHRRILSREQDTSMSQSCNDPFLEDSPLLMIEKKTKSFDKKIKTRSRNLNAPMMSPDAFNQISSSVYDAEQNPSLCC